MHIEAVQVIHVTNDVYIQKWFYKASERVTRSTAQQRQLSLNCLVYGATSSNRSKFSSENGFYGQLCQPRACIRLFILWPKSCQKETTGCENRLKILKKTRTSSVFPAQQIWLKGNKYVCASLTFNRSQCSYCLSVDPVDSAPVFVSLVHVGSWTNRSQCLLSLVLNCPHPSHTVNVFDKNYCLL